MSKRIGDVLQGAALPDESGAEARAWRIVSGAYAGRRTVTRRRRSRRPLVVALATLLVLAALAATPAGPAVADWIDNAFHPGRHDANPALVRLPASGRLLVTSQRGPWVVQQDGSKRRLGRYQDAAWSPGGLFVVVTTRHELVALEPDGDPRWSLARSPTVSRPAWSPDGFRIGYLSGSTLRVVAGDGTGDAPLAREAAAVAPAWRPHADHVLAYADRAGRIHLSQTDRKRSLRRSPPGPIPSRLVWTPDGRRLLALDPGSVRVLDAAGRVSLTLRPPPGGRAEALAVDPSGHRAALASYDPRARRSEVLDVPLSGGRPRRLFAGAGRFSDVAWSPDGRWLLIAWPDADQLLFVRAGARPKVAAVSNIAGQFDPGGRGAFPKLGGWCCAPGTP
jgi:WD40 repeat protein